MSDTPILDHKFHDKPSLFQPENLLREARRQKGITEALVTTAFNPSNYEIISLLFVFLSSGAVAQVDTLETLQNGIDEGSYNRGAC